MPGIDRGPDERTCGRPEVMSARVASEVLGVHLRLLAGHQRSVIPMGGCSRCDVFRFTPSSPNDETRTEIVMSPANRRIAIVGAGPAGLFAAEHLLKRDATVQLDVIDKLPVPYGLARYGVAPDNLKIKSVIGKLGRIRDNPRLRFIGNVTYGVDVTWADMDLLYDAVVFATGAPRSHQLGIPGETLPGSIAAADFVAWYNGYPQHQFHLDRSVHTVAVIGAGNVALDVSRILAKDPSTLKHTDIPEEVLAALAAGSVREVHLLARRGAAFTKFSTAELREIADTDGVELVVEPGSLDFDEHAHEHLATDRNARMVVDILGEISRRQPTTQGTRCRVHLHFGVTPMEILGSDAVRGIKLRARNGAGRHMSAQMVIRSIGYRGTPLPDLPFATDSDTIPHLRGRVIPGPDRAFVAGWCKRGPNGVIGTNKSCAGETIDSVLSMLDVAPTRAEGDIVSLLAAREHPITTLEECRRIDQSEHDHGRRLGRNRVKITDFTDFLATNVSSPSAQDTSIASASSI